VDGDRYLRKSEGPNKATLGGDGKEEGMAALWAPTERAVGGNM